MGRALLNIINGIIWFIGLAGIPDDVRTWQGWLKPVVDFLETGWGRLAVIIIGLIMFYFVNLWRRPTDSAIVKAKHSLPPKPQPSTVRFGYPGEGAGEPFVSIWKIPVELVGDEASEPKFYNRCTAKLVFRRQINVLPPELDMRCEQRGIRGGAPEFSVVIGEDPRLIPIAIRSEISWDQLSASEARFMDEAFFEQSPNPVTLGAGDYEFFLRVSSGSQRWESRDYQLRVPMPGVSNGKFIVRPIP